MTASSRAAAASSRAPSARCTLQLPPVLLQPGRVDERHLDAVGRAGLAGAQLTGSSVALGITVGLQFGPVLVLGAWAGALADRVDKRKLLIVTQSAAAVLALVLGVLTVTDVVTVWMIWVLAALTGTALALGMPSRQSFVYEMVGPDDLANAVGLNGVVINSSRIIGPAIGGVLIASVGVAPCFLFNAASFIAVIVALLLMRPASSSAASPSRGSGARCGKGFKYVWRTPALRVPLIMLAVISMLAYNYSVVLPLLTKERVRPRRRRLRRPVRGDGRRRARRRPAHGQPARPSRRLLVGSAFVFGVVTWRSRWRPGTTPRRAPRGHRRRRHAVQRHHELAAAAQRRPRHARPRDGALGGRVPRQHAIGGPITGLIVRGLGVRWAMAIGGVATLATAAVASPPCGAALRGGHLRGAGSACRTSRRGDALGRDRSTPRPTRMPRGRAAAAPGGRPEGSGRRRRRS